MKLLVGSKVIAVSIPELMQYGCLTCGYRSGIVAFTMSGAAYWTCGDVRCREVCCALADGLTESPIAFDDYYPTLERHPRHGIPSHGNPDICPPDGGEYFSPEDISVDKTPECFVCGGLTSLHHSLTAFVQCKAIAERVVALFEKGVCFEYYTHAPDSVCVKIGACEAHLSSLERLHLLTKRGIITAEFIRQAQNGES